MGTRRSFLIHQAPLSVTGAAAFTNIQTRAMTNQQTQVDAADLQIIDCHTHFYDPERPAGVPWPAKGSPLYRTVLPAHLRALAKSHPLAGTVAVEASPRVEDNQWLLELAEQDPFIVGIVGHLTPGGDRFPDDLKRFAVQPLFRGIRVGRATIADLSSAKLLRHLEMLADHDLQLDVNGGPDMPSAVAALAHRVPTLRIVINHAANLPIDGGDPPRAWSQGMRQAAAHPHVFCKVSALVEAASRNAKPAPKQTDFYRPVLDELWRHFGQDRLIFGSNWPVCESAADYTTLFQIVYRYVQSRGPVTTRKFFADNGQRAYRWRSRKRRST